VVGPLTPAGASVLASLPSIPVPTLVLNRVDTQAPDHLYSFGLMLENEARQAARVASLAQMQSAIIISSDNALSRRLVDAFQTEWRKLGGKVVEIVVFNGDTSVFSDLPVAPGNMVFIAANADTARRFRPFLDPMLPVYATSQIFKGNTHTLINYDLRDVVFFDMPWLLEQDKPVVKRYPRLNPPGTMDMERLYALGIDAYRLSWVLLGQQQNTVLPLDGVTGTITLGSNHSFDRQAVQAEFENGQGITLEAFEAQQKANKGIGK
jgi:outer membrane PBP1 activator LpoA protein